MIFPAAMALALMRGVVPETAIMIGLIACGAVFAMRSAGHSCLVVGWSDSDKVSLNVGFYICGQRRRLPGRYGIIRQAPGMPERFISEAIEPVVETFDTARMAVGEPGLPTDFEWRGRTIHLVEVLRTWKTTGPCRHGSPEVYVRKHWYEVRTSDDVVMKIYFDRQSRKGVKGGRWWLFSMQADSGN